MGTLSSTTVNGTLKVNNSTFLQQIAEKITVVSTAASGTINYDVLTQTLLYYKGQATANWVINVRGSSTATLTSLLAVGESLTIVFMNTNGQTARYPSKFQIDGTDVTVAWEGGQQPTLGTVTSIDVYTYSIFKTGNTTFSVFGSVNSYSETPPELFTYTSFTFTNCGAVGSRGPSLQQCQSAYSGQPWISNNFSVSNGIQRWTVPKSATYRITAAGASGGYRTSGQTGNATPGRGYIVRGDINLTEGETINIIVGQRGQTFNRQGNQAGPGGGGSFVWRNNNAELLFVGAGGNGESWESHSAGTDPNGQGFGASVVRPSPGRGSRGAGWTQDGENGSGSPTYAHARSIRDGGGYGANYTYNLAYYPYDEFPNVAGHTSGNGPISAMGGGFGGGGTATPYEGGGGGGYEGGFSKSTNQYASSFPTSGASSYAIPSASNRLNVGLNSPNQHGYVTIEKLN